MCRCNGQVTLSLEIADVPHSSEERAAASTAESIGSGSGGPEGDAAAAADMLGWRMFVQHASLSEADNGQARGGTVEFAIKLSATVSGALECGALEWFRNDDWHAAPPCRCRPTLHAADALSCGSTIVASMPDSAFFR